MFLAPKIQNKKVLEAIVLLLPILLSHSIHVIGRFRPNLNVEKVAISLQ